MQSFVIIRNLLKCTLLFYNIIPKCKYSFTTKCKLLIQILNSLISKNNNYTYFIHSSYVL